MFLRLLLALLALAPLLAAESAPLRTALLAWEAEPLRPDVQRVAADLLALAQAGLSGEPGLAWVERAELDKLLAEADLAASGRLDPRASLRLGKLARAQLLVTGRLDASDHLATTLVLEAIDLDRGDLLAASTTPLPPRAHRHYAVSDADLSVSKIALQTLLAEAAARHRELSAKPAVALLFLANTGPSSRLEPAGERLADGLRSIAADAGGRILRFARARDAEAEHDLAILGLAEADDQAWRGVADLYLWGEYKELPADGLAFADTPAEASLTLWDGASAPRTIPWRGTVATFPAAAEAFAAALRPAVRRTSDSQASARATAAASLLSQASAVEQQHRPSLEKPEFWKSELGRNVHRHRIRLLETASFLDPAASKPRRLLYDVRWHRLAAPTGGHTAEQLWRRYADLRFLPEDSITRRSPDFQGHEANRRAEVLEDIMRAHGQRLRGEGRLSHPRIVRAAELWAREVNAHFTVLSDSKNPFGFGGDFSLREYLQTVTGDGPLLEPSVDPSVVGNQVLHIMIDGAWPALAPAFAEQYKSDRETAEVSAARILEVFYSVGREDIAHARLVAALDPEKKPTSQDGGPTGSPADRMREFEQLNQAVAEIAATLPVKLVPKRHGRQRDDYSIELLAPFGTPVAECTRLAADLRGRILAASLGISNASVTITPDPKAPARIEASGMPADPPIVTARWGSPDASPATPRPDSAAHPDLFRALPLIARPLHAWLFAGDFPSDLFARAYQQWPPNHRLTSPDHTRLLGFDGTHLWIEGLPIEGALNQEAAPYRLTAYSPYARSFHGLSPRLPSGSRLLAAHFDAQTAYLATEFDGLIKLGPTPATVLPVTPDDGLPSLKLSSLIGFGNGIAVAAAPPEKAAAYLDSASGQWRALRPPEPVSPAGKSAPRVATSRDASSSAAPNAGPRLAGAGPWLLYADTQPQLFNTSTQRWSDALAQYQSTRASLHERVRAHVLESLEAASARGDTAEVQTLLARRREIPDWALQPPSAVLGDDNAFWLAGPYGLVRLDPAEPARAHVEKCPPILALADAGPWLWIAFAPPADSLPQSRPGNPSFSPDSFPPHAAPYPHNEAPEWRRSRLALYDKASRRWLGSVEVAGGILSLAAAPGRLWAAGSDLYEFDTTTLLAPPPAPDPGFATHWAALPDHALHRAVTLHDHATLSARLTADPSFAHEASASGWTPLHAAASARNETALDLLLAAAPTGATDANAFTAEGASPLALAAAAGHPSGIRRLVAAGADPSGQHNPPPPPPLTEFGEANGSLPAVSPPQPVTAHAELLPTGTIRISWTLAPGPYDGFVIYRRDLDHLRREGSVTRWNVAGSDNDAKWDYLGEIVGTFGPETRSWTDLDLRPAAVNHRYTVIAINPHDRFGPRTPTAAVTIHAPALAAPPARLYAASPARFSPSPLHLAAAAGQTESVTALLDAGADPAARDQGGYTPHHAALLAGHLNTARALLARGAPVNARVPRPARDSFGAATVQAFQRPFHPALPGLRPVRGAGTALSLVYEGDADRELFKTLLSTGADPLLGPDGPLAVRAAFLGRADDVERFLALSPHPFVTDIYGRTAFAAALAAKRFTLARTLRERCFAPDDPRWPTSRAEDLGRNALTLAVNAKDTEMLVWLRERGATASESTWGDLLEIAVEQGHVENTRLLLAAGALPAYVSSELRRNLKDPELIALLEGKSPAPPPARTANTSNTSITRPATPAARSTSASPAPTPFLYPRKQYSRGSLYSPPPDNIWPASSTTVAQQAKDRTLLASAARGDLDALRAALADGARVDAVDEPRWTPLIHAIKGGHLATARVLIDHGASLNRLTAKGSTPLGFACDLPDLGFARELLDLGADPNLVDPTLPNALPLVTYMTKNPAAARLMLERGADPRVIVASHGRGGALPPVFLAARRADLRAVAILVAAGADATAVLWRYGAGPTRLRGQTALHSAAASNDLATLEYFLSLGLDPAQTEAYGDNALDMALLADADRTATRLRQLGVKTRAERGLPAR